MKGFDLPKNYLNNLEVLLRNTRAKLKKVLVVVLEDIQIRRSLTPEFEARRIRVSMNSLLRQQQTIVLDLKSMLETMDSSSSLHSLPWCKLISFVKRLMKMQVHTYNTF
jgi:hypothetical protein